MTIVFAGGEIASFIPSIPGSGEYNGQYDHTYARVDVFAEGHRDEIPQPNILGHFSASVIDFWTHIEWNSSIGEGIDIGWWPRILWGGVDNTTRFRLLAREKPIDGAAPALKMEYWDGGSFVQAGFPYAVEYIDKQVFDVHIQLGSPGRIRVYNGGTKVIDSGDIFPVSPNIGGIEFMGAVSGFTGVGTLASQVIVADTCTIGWKLMTYVPSGAGNDSAWTGTYADIDKVFDNYAATNIHTVTDNAVSNFAVTPITAPDGSLIKGFIVTAYARKGLLGGPSNLQMNMRTGGVNYFGTPFALDPAVLGPNITIWDTNPNTGLPWIDADLVGINVGAKAAP